MEEEKELIYSVRKIFLNYLKSRGMKSFNIPEYQRSYKWNADTVGQLLDDLSRFRKETGSEFYCLQNITVTNGDDRDCGYMNVIDGQQRLTTLFILLSFMQRKWDEKILTADAVFLKYSIRESTHDFLQTKVLTGKIWDKPILPKDAESKDEYYIMEVADAIRQWFEDYPEGISRETLLDDLRIIVNEVNSNEEETVFANLNGGKVDLDGSDLMRAILITRAAKQRYPEKNKDMSKVSAYRVKLGVELDSMVQWWADKDVQAYFAQLLPEKIKDNRGFRFSRYPLDLLYFAVFEVYRKMLLKEGEEGKLLNIRHFENGIDINRNPGDDHLEFYNQLKDLHLTLVDWYEDDETYNLIGYLMYNHKSARVSFSLLWRMWEKAESKTDFKRMIKRVIRCVIARDVNITEDVIKEALENEKSDEVEEGLIELRRRILDTEGTDWYSDPMTVKFLPLLDLLPFSVTVSGKERKTMRQRIRQQYFKVNKEDKEHIRSQKRDYDKENLSEEDKEMLLEENREGLNSLGNIVLLSSNVNRSYRNSKFTLKISRICNEYILGDTDVYIRPHTFSVFVSKMEGLGENGLADDDLFWSKADVERTVKDIDRRLAEYLDLPVCNDNKNGEDDNNG